MSQLSKFYRTIKLFTKLPSSAQYPDSVVTLNDDNEVGVRGMTGYDEMMLKNPDALLNGEAVSNMLTSCVVNLKDPSKLFINDVNALVIAIKIASYGETHAFNAKCPNCGAEHKYEANLQDCLDNMKTFDEYSTVELSNGLTAFVRPFTLREQNVAMKKAFEQTKVARELASMTEEERTAAIGKQVVTLVELNYQLLASCIAKVVGDNGEFELVNSNATTKDFKDLLANIEAADAAKIDQAVSEMNSIGADTAKSLVCTECEHHWKVDLELNPTSFFTGS